MNSIRIKGIGGQGIKTIAMQLAKDLEKKGFNIAVTLEYDSYVRGGKSEALLIFSKEEIINPLEENPDLIYDFNEKITSKEEIEKEITNLLKHKNKK